MVLPVSRLTDFKKVVARQVVSQPSQNHFFKALWDKWQVWHMSEVFQVTWIQSRLLQGWCYKSLLSLLRDYTCGKRGIDNNHDQWSKVVKALICKGSRDQISHAAPHQWDYNEFMYHFFSHWFKLRGQKPFKNSSKGWWVTWAWAQVFAYTFNLVTEKVTKPIGEMGPMDVWWERGGAGLRPTACQIWQKAACRKNWSWSFNRRTVSYLH